MIYSVIMAGGKGERFWPKSRLKTPKQLLAIVGNNTMIQDTVNRLESVCVNENILVITNSVQSEEIKKQLPFIPVKNIVSEPCSRNTAPCIALATAFVKNDDDIMIILPADHVIKNKEMFLKNINDTVNMAQTQNALFTIGINPVFPATGYGYIHFKEKISSGTETDFCKVAEFTEKPDIQRAQEFILSGQYYWNSGIFIWKKKVFVQALKKFMPDLYAAYLKIADSIKNGNFDEEIAKIYPGLPNISIDYGIMEKADNVIVAKSLFDWDDAGSWDAVAKYFPTDEYGNSVKGKFMQVDSKNCIVYSDKKLVAALGAKNLIIVVTDDAVLVCDKSRSQDIKEIVKKLSSDSETQKYLN